MIMKDMAKSGVAVGLFILSSCATSQGAMLEQSSLEEFTSTKEAGQVAGCAQQALRGGPTMGTDGKNFWVTRQSTWGTVVRYDFKPSPTGSGSIVEYRSRLKVNNGLDKVKACL
ncbi:hypothetical protein U1769_24315 [Sphingomonas sp. ZT3P38]|uniref:hypothetical protein n=1 Tax=Parasphingomonas zepuensis TaxID=3096161 RepID=UPI002FCB4394